MIGFSLICLGLTLAAAPAADPIVAVGQTATVPWEGHFKAYVVPAETGLKFDIAGPQNVLLEFRSRNRGKRVIIDVIREEHFRSRNASKLRAMPSAKLGYRFVTLLALRVPAGTHRYAVLAQGADLVVIPRVTKTFTREFAARTEEDVNAIPSEEAAIAAAGGASAGGPAATPVESVPVSEHAADEQDLAPSKVATVEDLSGSEESGGDASAVKVALAEDALAVGGKVYLRYDLAASKNDPLTKDLFSSPNFADVYLDARPADRVRGFVLGRLFYDPTVAEGARDALGRPVESIRPLLDQLWLKTDIGRAVFITAGRQHLAWGTGRIWTPFDVFYPVHRDPFEVVDERGGLDLIKLHLPVESLGWNFYALGQIQKQSNLNHVRGAFRGEFVFGPSELAAMAVVQNNARPQLGLDFSAGIWVFDVRGEALFQQGGDRVFYRGDLDFSGSAPVLPTAYTRPDKWYPELSVGLDCKLNYGDNDTLTLTGEYFHNAAGYANNKLYLWLLASGAFDPYYVSRDYAAALLTLPNPSSWDETTLVFASVVDLSDRSWVGVFQGRVSVYAHLDLVVTLTGHFGDPGVFHMGVIVPPNVLPTAPAGIRVAAPFVDVNLGALVNL